MNFIQKYSYEHTIKRLNSKIRSLEKDLNDALDMAHSREEWLEEEKTKRLEAERALHKASPPQEGE